MSLRRALRDRSVLRTAAYLSLVGGTALVVADDQVTILANGPSLAVVVKTALSYAALFLVAISAAAYKATHEPVRVPEEQR